MGYHLPPYELWAATQVGFLLAAYGLLGSSLMGYHLASQGVVGLGENFFSFSIFVR